MESLGLTPLKTAVALAAVGAAATVAAPALSRLTSDEHSFKASKWMGVTSRRDRVEKLKLKVNERLSAPGLSEYFLNKDFLFIYYRRWLPQGNVDPTPPKGVVIIVHGLGEHTSRYNEVARALNGAGLVVYGLDHQGHGRSEGDRGFVRKFSDYADDVVALTRIAKAENPGLKCFLLGHSMGGAISLVALAAAQHEFQAAVISGPLVKADPSQAGPVLQTLVGAFSALLPRLKLDYLKLDTLCRAPTVVDLYCNDPLVGHAPLEARLAHELLTFSLSAMDYAPKIRLPYLLVHGTRDTLCSIQGSDEFHQRTASTDKKYVRVEGGFHETLNEDPKVVKEVVDYLKSRL